MTKIKQLFTSVAVIALLFSTLPAQVYATTQYSFENSEKLKPLINWNEYGPDAFSEAINENKPIFLLLTAPSWCYWCQVYESKDYLFNPAVVEKINNNFVPIYVDADKRQDLTRQYLEGGWPSTTILSPNKTRIFGYSGVRPVENMLANLDNAVAYVKANAFSDANVLVYKKTESVVPTVEQLQALLQSYSATILGAYDPVYGGFGNGQKFPQPRTEDFSLDTYQQTKDPQWLQLVTNTLKNGYTKNEGAATSYHLFDPVEGAFFRYGTTQTWSPPHYEKMLYDNVRLLKTYSHLLQIEPDNPLAEEVVNKTKSYIQKNWYDNVNGGFYGNTDSGVDGEYYKQFPRSSIEPAINKTKYTDWNSEAIITYLYLWNTQHKASDKAIAVKTLNYYAAEMANSQGAFHFVDEQGVKGIQGNLLDNTYLLLAFANGYDTFGDKRYLETAQQLADYSLSNLYDWYGGGFFERHSSDSQSYAPQDMTLLTKPAEENGIMAYALLNVYQQTNDVRYLNAGIKTLGSVLNSAGGLDSGYYAMRAAQLALDENLVSAYLNRESEIEQVEGAALQNFWVDGLSRRQSIDRTSGFTPTNVGLDTLQGPLLLLLLIAFLAGLLSLASPCTLPILPAYVAYTFESSKKNIKGMSLSFFFGLTLIFTLLGMSATFVGSFLKQNITIFSQVSGIAIILFGVYILLGKGFTGLKLKQNKPVTYAGSFAFGSIFALAWTPCIGPILVAILLLASTASSVLTGGLLLFTYAGGIAVPLIFFSHYLSKADRNGRVWKIIGGKELNFKVGNKELRVHSTTLLSGILFIVLGYLIWSGTLFALNQYVGTSDFQKWIFVIEGKLLNIVK